MKTKLAEEEELKKIDRENDKFFSMVRKKIAEMQDNIDKNKRKVKRAECEAKKEVRKREFWVAVLVIAISVAMGLLAVYLGVDININNHR